MAFPLPIQPARLRRGGLASVVAPLEDVTVEQWRDGIDPTFQCDVAGGRWGCSGLSAEGFGLPAEGGLKDPFDLDGESPRVYPTLIWTTTGCTVAGTQTIIGNVIDRQGRQALDRIRWSAIADLLFDGQNGRDSQPNTSFMGNAVVAPGTDLANPVGIVPTIQGMLEAMDGQRDQQGVLHVPQQYLPYFLKQHLVEWDGSNYRMGADLLVSFDEYPNSGTNNTLKAITISVIDGDLVLSSGTLGADNPSRIVVTVSGVEQAFAAGEFTIVNANTVSIPSIAAYGSSIERVVITDETGTTPINLNPPLDATVDGGGGSYNAQYNIPPDDQFWMYLTARPLVALDTERVDAVLTAQQNRYDVRAEQGAIAVLDPCLIVAGLARVCA